MNEKRYKLASEKEMNRAAIRRQSERDNIV